MMARTESNLCVNHLHLNPPSAHVKGSYQLNVPGRTSLPLSCSALRARGTVWDVKREPKGGTITVQHRCRCLFPKLSRFDTVYMDGSIRVATDSRGDTLVVQRDGPPRVFE